MRYENTWFSKHPVTCYGSFKFERTLWLYHYVEVVGGFVPMHNVNDDGSIDVLGVEKYRLSQGFSFGSHDRKGLQRSLSEHATKLTEAGATILKQTKNKLVARHGNETAYYIISPLTSKTFFEREWGDK